MKAADPGGAEGGTATPQFQSQLDSSKGSGHALPDHIQNDFGKATGNDLGDVKVHTDSNAHNMAQSIQAKAFTHGQDIYFRQGQYNPNTESGKQLIYHESHHTVQQSRGVQRKVQRNWFTDAFSYAVAPIAGAVQLGKNIYQYSQSDPATKQKIVQANLQKEIDALRSGPSPSLPFKIAYYGAAPLAGALNPMGMGLMPSLETMWKLWVKAKLGYYKHLVSLSKNPPTIKQKNESTGKEEDVKNPDYAAGGFYEVMDNHMKNMADPMFAVGGIKGVVLGIVGWVVDIFKLVGWLGASAWNGLMAMKDWMVDHKPPGWVNTLMDRSITAALWLNKNGRTFMQFIGAVIAPQNQQQQQVSAQFKSAAEEGTGGLGKMDTRRFSENLALHPLGCIA